MELDDILSTHDDLDEVIRNPNGRVFISEWNCENPFIEEYMGDLSRVNIPRKREGEYVYFKDDYYLSSMIGDFHKNHDHLDLKHDNILPGAGSTPLIASFCMWLVQNKIDTFYYIPPLYYTFYYYSDLFSIKARPVSYKHAFDKNFSCRLPKEKAILILCDPIWFSGISVNQEIISDLKQWQQDTGSIIFIDGSFQYCKWSSPHKEHTADLDPNLTFRLICPTKALAIHGYRFSYLLLPPTMKEKFIYLYENITGATVFRNLIFAHQAMSILSRSGSNYDLYHNVRMRYNTLIEKDLISPLGNPDCGYFVFAKLRKEVESFIGMDGSYFDLNGFEGYSRINMLGPNVMKLLSGSHFNS